MFRSISPWSRRRPSPSLPAPSSLRMEVCPPSLRCAPAGLWRRLLFWMMGTAPRDAAPPLARLPAVRTDFLASLSDIADRDADPLRQRIRDTRTLRELWHLRAEVYRVVGVAHSQGQAEQRLSLINRHFATRAARSQFAFQ